MKPISASIIVLAASILIAGGAYIQHDDTKLFVVGSRLVKPMQTSYKANDEWAESVFSAFAHFGGQISAAGAAVLSGYGSY